MLRQIYKNTAQRLRLKNKAKASLPDVEKIPILIPPKALDAIKVDGCYEFVESIAFPTEGTGGIYTKEYFQSVIEYMKEYPIPGSKDGHDSQADDFYTIGGELQMTSENEGVCYLRIIVPPEGWDSSNAALIRSLKAGIPELSFVADVEQTRGSDGKVYFTKELGRPRNDIVPEGAMDVAISNSMDEKEIMALIEKGAIDMNSESNELVKNGKVFRKAAVNLQSTSDKALAGRVLNAIAVKTKNTKERNGMNKDELITALKAAIANNQITLEEIANAVGLENKLRKSSDADLEEMKAELCEALDLPPDTTTKELIKEIEEVLEELKELEETTVDITADELANGKRIKNADGTESDNPVYLYAKKVLKGLHGKQLNSAAEKLKNDPVMIALRSRQADTLVNARGTNEVIHLNKLFREV